MNKQESKHIENGRNLIGVLFATLLLMGVATPATADSSAIRNMVQIEGLVQCPSEGCIPCNAMVTNCLPTCDEECDPCIYIPCDGCGQELECDPCFYTGGVPCDGLCDQPPCVDPCEVTCDIGSPPTGISGVPAIPVAVPLPSVEAIPTLLNAEHELQMFCWEDYGTNEDFCDDEMNDARTAGTWGFFICNHKASACKPGTSSSGSQHLAIKKGRYPAHGWDGVANTYGQAYAGLWHGCPETTCSGGKSEPVDHLRTWLGPATFDNKPYNWDDTGTQCSNQYGPWECKAAGTFGGWTAS